MSVFSLTLECAPALTEASGEFVTNTEFIKKCDVIDTL